MDTVGKKVFKGFQPRPGMLVQTERADPRVQNRKEQHRGEGARGRSPRNKLQPLECSTPSGSSQIASFQKLTRPKQPMKMFANHAVRLAFRYIKHTTVSTDPPSP